VSYNLPANVYSTLVNKVNTDTNRVNFQEIVTQIDFSNNPQFDILGNYPVATVNMAPILNKPNSRIRNLALCYEKYRYTKCRLIIRPGAPTTTVGSYICAYSENPDFDPGVDPIGSLSALRGSTTAPLWGQMTIDAVINDKNKWYNVDPDSEEIMMCEQGKWFIVQTAVANTSFPIKVQVWMEGTIEFRGAARQVDTYARFDIKILPEGSLARTNKVTNLEGVAFDWLSNEGGTVEENFCYRLSPGFGTREGENVGYVWMTKFDNVLKYLFTRTEDEALEGKFLTHEQVLGEALGDPMPVPAQVCIEIYKGEVPVPARSARAVSTTFTPESITAARHRFMQRFRGGNLDLTSSIPISKPRTNDAANSLATLFENLGFQIPSA